MHNQVRQWSTQGFIAELLDLLIEHDFMVYLTSDHGNIEASGYGSPSEGSLAEIRGVRVRVYPDQSLRASVKERFTDAIEWPPIGLPDSYLPLFAPGRLAFVHENERRVAHGGLALEEVIVPFVQIYQKDRLI